jgi:hypothetical protein
MFEVFVYFLMLQAQVNWLTTLTIFSITPQLNETETKHLLKLSQISLEFKLSEKKS